MADSHRLVVLKKMTALLKEIVPTVDHNIDLSSAVFRGRAVFGAGHPLPMVSILEAPRSDQGNLAGENSVTDERWALMVQGWVEDDLENPTDPAYELLDVVEKKLGEVIATKDDGSGRPVDKEKYLFGNLIAGLTIGSGIVRPPMENISSKSFFYLPVSVRLVRDVGR